MVNNPKNYFKITLRKKMKFFTAALVATAANAIQLEAEAQSSHVSAALREIQWGIHDAKATVEDIKDRLDNGKDVIITGLQGDIINALAIIQKGWEDSDLLIYDAESSMGYGTHLDDTARFAYDL